VEAKHGTRVDGAQGIGKRDSRMASRTPIFGVFGVGFILHRVLEVLLMLRPD
jgi:hypothetical protein